eukprot:266418_1
MFCNAFRVKKLAKRIYESMTSLKERNRKYANMAKFLMECVQCYGRLFLGKKKYYRGVNKWFIFKKFVTRYHVPLSTTGNFEIATSFAESEKGLVMELRKYDNGHDISCFDCSISSSFDHEKEILFFGGNCVLQISSIYQVYNETWTSHRHHIESIQGIVSLTNGYL